MTDFDVNAHGIRKLRFFAASSPSRQSIDTSSMASTSNGGVVDTFKLAVSATVVTGGIANLHYGRICCSDRRIGF